jgi:hypothetical protein
MVRTPRAGVLALEGLGISVDPKTRSLKRERDRVFPKVVFSKVTSTVSAAAEGEKRQRWIPPLQRSALKPELVPLF